MWCISFPTISLSVRLFRNETHHSGGHGFAEGVILTDDIDLLDVLIGSGGKGTDCLRQGASPATRDGFAHCAPAWNMAPARRLGREQFQCGSKSGLHKRVIIQALTWAADGRLACND